MPASILRGWRRRFPNWRFAFVSFSLAASTLATAAAALALHGAWKEHERAMERTLSEHASEAARSYGELLIRASAERRVRALAAVLGAPAVSDPADALPLAAFAERAEAALRAQGVGGDPWLGAFRVDPAAGRVEGTGSMRRPGLAAMVAERAQERLREAGPEPPEPVIGRLEVDGEPLTIYFARQRTTGGATVALYGVVQSRRAATAALSGEIMARLPLLLPPSLVPPGWHYDRDLARGDTLLAVEMRDYRGRFIYRSPGAFAGPSVVTGEFVYRTDPGGFTVRATLSPRVVERIRAGYRRDARRRWALLLPVLSVVLSASAIVHLLRERELVRARRDFVAGVSHELRTPLAQIQLCAETLLGGRARTDEERARWLGVIGREAYRLGALVENVLAFSHLERDGVRLAREPTDLAALLEEAADAYEPFAEPRRVRLVVDAAPGLTADVDPRAVRQVVGNLLDNALKYGPDGQTVRVAAARIAPGRALVTVADQGPGVPRAERERVWKPFERLTHQGGTAGGSGLGLAVVRTLVAQHGGEAFVDDAPGGGARFAVVLPLVPTAAAAEREEAEAEVVAGRG